MFKILKNLKQSWMSVLVIVALLCVQAAVDLELPNYTSKIVNTGIQAGGIEYAVPETISQKDMDAILLFSNDDDKILENLKERFENMLKINGATTLSNFIRTYIHTTTSMSGMPPIITPMINFVEFFKEENREN